LGAGVSSKRAKSSSFFKKALLSAFSIPERAATPYQPSSHTFSGIANMPSKPNYNHQRAERDRAKKASKETKLQERKAQAALRKAGEAGEAAPSEAPDQAPRE
jgi:hypothetical protein